MATAGIGVDMLEIKRMERVLGRRPNFARRVFTDEERAYCERCARPAEHYAARFAAREAVVKALGTGFSDGVSFRDVSVGRDDSGRPRAILSGRAAQIAQERGIREIALSISHTHDVAVANAIAVTDDVRPEPDARQDAARALASSFKEARSILDELERVQEDELSSVSTLCRVQDGQGEHDAPESVPKE
ncbi:MAG TPA: holo-ACP synthase [Candidatus Olsenella pullicola]|nr:holo-ACP synthase [Candidatus Olsenella pullicola]